MAAAVSRPARGRSASALLLRAEGQCQRSLWTLCLCYLLASEKFGLVSWLLAGLGLAPAPEPGSLTGEAKGADTQWPVVLLGVRGGVGLPGT